MWNLVQRIKWWWIRQVLKVQFELRPKTNVEQVDQTQSFQMSLSILESIRCVDARLDELKMIARLTDFERREVIRNRMTSLLDTRFKLICSFMDLNADNSAIDRGMMNPFDSLKITYHDLKRQIS